MNKKNYNYTLRGLQGKISIKHDVVLQSTVLGPKPHWVDRKIPFGLYTREGAGIGMPFLFCKYKALVCSVYFKQIMDTVNEFTWTLHTELFHT